MPIDVDATRAWAKENKAAWEVEPLFETRDGERVQVGFRLDLYARLAVDLPSEQAFAALWDRLREIAESLLGLAGSHAQLGLDPFDAAGRLRPETGFAPEVLLQACLVHAKDDEPRDEDDRDRVRSLEERLTELGLRQRSW